jgi:hypothetical protein
MGIKVYRDTYRPCVWPIDLLNVARKQQTVETVQPGVGTSSWRNLQEPVTDVAIRIGGARRMIVVRDPLSAHYP